MLNFGGLGLAGMNFSDQPKLTQACFRNNPDEIRSLLFKVINKLAKITFLFAIFMRKEETPRTVLKI